MNLPQEDQIYPKVYSLMTHLSEAIEVNKIKVSSVLVYIFDYLELEDLEIVAQVCKLFCYTATLDCLYPKFEVIMEQQSAEEEDSDESEECGMDLITKKDKNYELETMHKINPALRTRQTILATQVVYDIPEEESEWNDEEHDHFDEDTYQPPCKDMQKIISDFYNECEIGIISRQYKRTNTSDKVLPKPEFHFHKAPIDRKSSNHSKDRFDNTIVFSERMGDAYSDSQHINDGIITVRSRDLVKSPFNLDRINIIQPTHEGSSNKINDLKSKLRCSNSIMSMHHCLPNDFGHHNEDSSSSSNTKPNRFSVMNPPSFPSAKNILKFMKRDSNFVRLDFGSGYRNSKMSVLSFNKQSTLQSIPELPGEQNNIESNNKLQVINQNIAAAKRKSAFHNAYDQRKVGNKFL